MNTNSNTYTIIYASIVVIVVAFLLAFVSSALSDRIGKNVELDKKKQILSSLNADFSGKTDSEVADLYTATVKADLILNAAGEVLKENGGFAVEVKDENAKDLAERQLPLYVCEWNGETKYVLPLRGAGLWGPIWGYIALNADKNTVYGVYFSHESETPGLGAEITKDKFKSQFADKQIRRGDNLTYISVVKKGKESEDTDFVYAITGGTMTSNGVDAMIKDGMSQYANFLNQ
ncbi:MAG: NADH:ubiquinone reductase (Na(+)-transporting) subunit C [Paludibacteraceae bacterium]|nr:NADH:ubiquinone reductase (Na(+)-transporting) subunit C [Paludibacteraceae bacterium]